MSLLLTMFCKKWNSYKMKDAGILSFFMEHNILKTDIITHDVFPNSRALKFFKGNFNGKTL